MSLGLGFDACWVGRAGCGSARRRHLLSVRRDRFRRLRGGCHGRYAGNGTSRSGHSQLPASGGNTVLKCTDVSPTLVLAGNLANCPKPAFRKFKERRPGAEVRVIREASDKGPLVLLYTLRCGGVAGAESETGALRRGEIVVCFYDTVSIIYAGSHTRVWVKCIRQQDVEDTIADKGVLGKKIVDNAARKIIAGYVPPFVVVGGN